MTEDHKEYEDYKCNSCNSDLILESKRSYIFGSCSNNNCSKIWMLMKSSNEIQAFECEEVNFLIEFNVELPFNLALPTGRYFFNKPNELMLRRDMYYFQKGNEIENPLTMLPFYAFQNGVFNDFGIFKEEHDDKEYKRKMKTVLFKRYPVFGLIRKDIEIETFLESKYVKETIYKVQIQFQRDVNEFLMYYSLYFPINDINNTIQHEIRPISIYEFNKCLFNSQAIINEKLFPIKPIIQDFTNLKGVPDITYCNLNNKIEEFEKVIKDRRSLPLFNHHQLFILARSLYRTNRIYMGATIISTAMTAYEALIHSLEIHHFHFQNLKKVRKTLFKQHPNLKKPGKKRFGFLEFYTEYARPSIARLISSIHKEKFVNFKEILNHFKILNITRWIRNDIVHEAKFDTKVTIDYEVEKGFTDQYQITYLDKSKNIQKIIEFRELWNSFLKIYDVLNTILLESIYNKIDWNIKTEYEKENLAYAIKKARHIIDTIPNINWREINAYNFDLKSPSVPPELFKVNMICSDGKEISINVPSETKEAERFEDPLAKMEVDLTSEEIERNIKDKKSFAFLNYSGRFYIYSSCENCGYILPLHSHHDYRNDTCPRCQSKFDLDKKWIACGMNLFNQGLFQEAITCSKRALEINPNNDVATLNIGSSFLQLDKADQALKYFEKIDINKLEEKKKNILLIHKALAYYELKRRDEAWKLIESVLRSNPDLILALHNKCALLIKERRIDEALEIIERLGRLDPNYPFIYYLMAKINIIQGDRESSLKNLVKAVNIDSTLKKFITETPEFEELKELKEFNDLIS
ncbi:MAG: tetratricopeptide repeat protein [Candidatus Thorarchaeota archaeon]